MVLRRSAAVGAVIAALAAGLLTGCAHRTASPQPAAPSGDAVDTDMNHYGGTPSTPR